jgi:hypothetical protein
MGMERKDIVAKSLTEIHFRDWIEEKRKLQR